MTNPYQTRGLQGPNGQCFIEVRSQDKAAVIPLSQFSMRNKQLESTLQHLNIAVFDKNDKEALIAEVKAVTSFEPALVIEAPGWSGVHFVIADGAVVQPPQDREPVITFVPDQSRIIQTGNLDEWESQVAMKISGQRIPMLAVMASLAPPLMRFMPHAENIVIELIGGHGTGKSTIVAIASSTIGGNGIISTAPYATPLAALMSEPRSIAHAHRDHPMMIEGVDVFAGQASRKELVRAYNFLANELPSLGRAGPSSEVRTVTLLTGRVSVRTLAELGSAEGADGLITLQVPAGRHGAFDSLPADHQTAAAFADAMTLAAAQYHGAAFRELVDRLARLSVEQRQALVQRLTGWQQRFLKRVTAYNEPLAGTRAARSFATIYAAGKYAKRLKILPANWNCWSATFKCLKSIHPVATAAEPFADRLEDLVASDTCLAVSEEADMAAQAHLARSRGATVWTLADRREVRITAGMIEVLFPDWNAIKKSEEVSRLLIREIGDGKRLNKKNPLAPGEPSSERLYCFRLPPQQLSEEDSIFPTDGPTSDTEAAYVEII